MWNTFLRHLRQDPTKTLILSFVLIAHLGLVLFAVFSPYPSLHKKKHPSLIVKTVAAKPLATEKKKPHLSLAQRAKTATPPAKKTEPVKKTPPPPSSIKKEVAKPKAEIKKEPAVADKTLSKSKTPPVKKTEQSRAKISDSLLKELEESIAKIDGKPDKTPTKPKQLIPITLQIDNLIEDASSDQVDVNYADILVNQLHAFLSLPEYGEVKIQLSLRQDGSVVRLVVLKTQNEKNKRYLESALPRIKFPRFEGAYANKKEYTFILTFCNE